MTNDKLAKLKRMLDIRTKYAPGQYEANRGWLVLFFIGWLVVGLLSILAMIGASGDKQLLKMMAMLNVYASFLLLTPVGILLLSSGAVGGILGDIDLENSGIGVIIGTIFLIPFTINFVIAWWCQGKIDQERWSLPPPVDGPPDDIKPPKKARWF